LRAALFIHYCYLPALIQKHHNTKAGIVKLTIMTDMMNVDVDFPPQRKHPVLRFADTVQLYIVERQEDYGKKKNNNNDDDDNNKVARHELWYTEAEFHSMRRAVEQDALHVRAQALAGVPCSYAGDDDDDASAVESSVSICCIGIEHLLTRACTLEVKACRARCIRAVLAEQARQDASEMNIALASLSQTRKAKLRAWKLGDLHRNSI
jgi:hypothetical protein